MVSEDYDWLDEAGAIADGDFERSLSAKRDGDAAEFDARLRAGSQQNGIDIGNFHRQCKNGTIDHHWPIRQRSGIFCFLLE